MFFTGKIATFFIHNNYNFLVLILGDPLGEI